VVCGARKGLADYGAITRTLDKRDRCRLIQLLRTTQPSPSSSSNSHSHYLSEELNRFPYTVTFSCKAEGKPHLPSAKTPALASDRYHPSSFRHRCWVGSCPFAPLGHQVDFFSLLLPPYSKWKMEESSDLGKRNMRNHLSPFRSLSF